VGGDARRDVGRDPAIERPVGAAREVDVPGPKKPGARRRRNASFYLGSASSSNIESPSSRASDGGRNAVIGRGRRPRDPG
jgi:hypothetical protein